MYIRSCMLLFGYILDFVLTGCSGFYADKSVFIHTSFVLELGLSCAFQDCSRLGLTWLISSLNFIYVLTWHIT